jgi:hypothetical protein
MAIWRIFVVGALVPTLLALGVAACGDDDDDDGDSEAGEAREADQLLHAALVTQVLDNAGFHDVEDSVADGEIPADARFTVLQMEALVRATDWPSELAEDALALADTMNEVAAVYDEGDAEAALEHAEAVHDGQHEFSEAVTTLLGESVGVEELTVHEEEEPATEEEATEKEATEEEGTATESEATSEGEEHDEGEAEDGEGN